MKPTGSLFARRTHQTGSRRDDGSVGDGRAVRRIAIVTLVFAMVLLGGCTITSRWEPVPQIQGLPQVAKHPVYAGVYYSPQFANQEQTRTGGGNVFVVPIGSASVQLFDNLLPRVFDKTSPVAGLSAEEIEARQVDVVVAPSLQHFDFRLGLDSDSDRYSVTYRTTLYSREGVPVASWLVHGNDRENSSLAGLTGMVENDMRDAATRFLQGFERSAGPALAAIARRVKGEAKSLDPASIVVRATRSDLPNVDPKAAAALRGAGVVAVRLVAENGSDRRLLMRASDTRLKLKNGSVLEPATVSAVLNVLDQVSHAGPMTAALVAPLFGHLVAYSEQASQQQERERQSTAVNQSLFSERTLGKGKEESGVIPFILPKGTAAADGMSLTAWVVDPASADGLQIAIPLAMQ